MFQMKKKIIILILIILICIHFSGCNEKINKNNIKSKLIGEWSGVSYYQNISVNISITFFIDNTAKQVDDHLHIHWYNFEIDNECVKLLFPELPEEYAICYDYEFSNNYNSLTLSNNTLDTIVLNKK
jgi:hypothetical protein